MYKKCCLLVLLLLFYACTKENNLIIDVSNINIETKIKRFDQAFYAPEADLFQLKNEYPYLFPAATPDSIWQEKRQDADELFLYEQTQAVYGDFKSEQQDINGLFKHIKYYYPNFKAPKVITLISNVDYERRVIYADSLLLVSLDVYLGQKSEVYQDFPDYIKQNFGPEHMLVAMAEAITKVQIPESADRTFISKMIQEGKRMYLLDAYLPLVSDSVKIGYTKEQIDWATLNQQDVWKYFIQNKMLFNTDQELAARFIDEAPFSKFYQANDNESPGRIGVWFGWQIVRSYMSHHKTTLAQLLKMSNDELFKSSKYKPNK